MINEFFFSPQFCLVALHTSRLFSTFLEIFQEIVHYLIFSIAISHWNCQSLRILKYVDIVDLWLPSFVHHFLKNYIISSLVRKCHVCTLGFQSWDILYSISWKFIISYLTMWIYIYMKKVPCGLFSIIWYLLPSYVWIVYKKHVCFWNFW